MQLKHVLELYGHFSGINRKIQLKYLPKGPPKPSSSEAGTTRYYFILLIDMLFFSYRT